MAPSLNGGFIYFGNSQLIGLESCNEARSLSIHHCVKYHYVKSSKSNTISLHKFPKNSELYRAVIYISIGH